METKCLILDFDNTLFDTSVDDEIRKNAKGRRNWDKIFASIPQYTLYDGWREVFDWAKENNIKIGIISEASGELIEKTLEQFDLNCDSVVGYQAYYEKGFCFQKMKRYEEAIIEISKAIEQNSYFEKAANLMLFALIIWCGFCTLEILNDTCNLGISIAAWFSGVRMMAFQLIYAFLIFTLYITDSKILIKYFYFY